MAPSRRLPFAATPIADWPHKDQARWRNSPLVPGWPKRYQLRIARGYGRLLGHGHHAGRESPVSRAAIEAFCATCERHLSPASVVAYMEALTYALLIVWPDGDWTWLQIANRALRAGHPSPPQSLRPPRLAPAPLALPVSQWPMEQQGRWTHALNGRQQVPKEPCRPFVPRSKRRRAVLDDSERPPDRTRGPCRAATWSANTRDKVTRAWGRYQGWAARTGGPTRPTPEALGGFVDDVVTGNPDISDKTIETYLSAIYAAACALYPEWDWQWLREDWRGVAALAQDKKDKRARYVPIQDLYAFGIDLMHRACEMPRAVRAAILYRDGYFIALASLRPKRAGNLLALRAGESLKLDREGNPQTLYFARTKNGDASDTDFPHAHLGVYHRVWWGFFRPVLLKTRHDEGDVWIGRDGTPLTTGQIWRQVRARTGAPQPEGLGRPVNPHLFRTCYATSMAEAAGDDRQLLALTPWMLDHRDPRSITHYNLLADSITAAHVLDHIQNALRRERPVPSPTPARRKRVTRAL